MSNKVTSVRRRLSSAGASPFMASKVEASTAAWTRPAVFRLSFGCRGVLTDSTLDAGWRAANALTAPRVFLCPRADAPRARPTARAGKSAESIGVLFLYSSSLLGRVATRLERVMTGPAMKLLLYPRERTASGTQTKRRSCAVGKPNEGTAFCFPLTFPGPRKGGAAS